MPDVIKLLPDSIANQIAAGEVIQRPASVVKELMENALDAGADHIRLIIKDAGKTLIQVIDNGSGMSDTDARLSFERHATSKIREAADLFQIKTMGFRGEALASIAAIAHIELKTCLQGSEVGTRIVISGSEVTNQEVCQHNQGTSISVKNLFYNVPARRKFLKSDPVELRHLLEEFHRIAIPNHEIRFQVQHNDKILFNLPAATRLQRIVNIFGKSWQENLIPVEEETADIFLSGYTGNPQDAKKTKTQQYLFINGRYFRSPYLNHAIKGAYENLIPDETRPAFFLFLETDPSMIDVNVHPTKQEIKFENDSLMYNLIKVSVRHALGKFAMMPSLDFDNESPVFSGNTTSQQIGPNPDTVSSQNTGSFSSLDREKQKSQIDSWKNLMKDVDQFASSKINELPRNTPILPAEVEIGESYAPLLQFKESYIIKTAGDQLLIFDQHRVHERILFEKFLNSGKEEQMSSQKLVFPVTHQFNPGDMEIFQALIPHLNKMGFELEHFGGETIIIHGIPTGFPDMDPSLVIEEVFDTYKGDRLDTGNVTKKMAILLARKSAIKKGARLNNKEMQDLLAKLSNCKESHISPIGKKTFLSIPIDEIERKLEK